jgi:Mor family transcriptional regulator
VEDYLNGLSPKKLERKYNITYAYVFRILKQNNVELRGQFSKSEEIKRDLKAGELTQSAIAKKYGVSRQRVNVIKKQLEDKNDEPKK